MTIIIFTYNRPEMLLRLLKECNGRGNVIAIDDGSEYEPTEHRKYCRYIRTEHGGKRWFWRKWRYAFDLARNETDEDILFLQDDVEQIDFDRLYTGSGLHVQHLLRMKRTKEWTGIEPKPMQWNGEDYLKVGFVDCIYKTNRKTVSKIGWYQGEVPAYWFMSDKISSGVGYLQSKLFTERGIPIYLPDRTIAHHGDHESQMHPETRKAEPLVTI